MADKKEILEKNSTLVNFLKQRGPEGNAYLDEVARQHYLTGIRETLFALSVSARPFKSLGSEEIEWIVEAINNEAENKDCLERNQDLIETLKSIAPYDEKRSEDYFLGAHVALIKIDFDSKEAKRVIETAKELHHKIASEIVVDEDEYLDHETFEEDDDDDNDMSLAFFSLFGL